jgi:hypothetical protein
MTGASTAKKFDARRYIEQHGGGDVRLELE